MHVLTTDLDQVAGGGAAYDAGHAIGGALHSTVDAIVYLIKNYNADFAM